MYCEDCVRLHRDASLLRCNDGQKVIRASGGDIFLPEPLRHNIVKVPVMSDVEG